MRGTITKRKLLATKDGKPIEQYYLVYDAGLKWNEKKGCYKRRQKWEKAKPNTRKAAEKQLARRLNEIEGGEFIEPSRMLFSEFKDRWLKNYAQGQVKPGTVEDYKGYFKNHLVPAFGDRPLSAITVEDVQGFKAGKLAEGYAPQTVKHLLRLFRQMLSHAEDWGYIRRNPAKKVQDPRVPHKEMDFLNPEDSSIGQ